MTEEEKEKREQVRRVLLIPIEVTTEVTMDKAEIFKRKDRIYSSQTYKSSLDRDMSDFSVGYYEILYRGIVGNILEEDKKKFTNERFAGDTINTGVYENKSRRKTRLLHGISHCLANFWVIPFKDGRKREKPKRDYVDSYLSYVEEWINEKDDNFVNFNRFSDFKKIHYIPNQVFSKSIQGQIDFIENRATLISQSDKYFELWKYFNNYGLI